MERAGQRHGGQQHGGLQHGGTRTLVVWGPDWPVVAARREGAAPEHVPVAILRANRVVAASSEARADGVQRGMRRREAQSRCAALELLLDDPARDARAFEPVLQAIERFAPLVEVVRPGLAQLATRGPSRYFGGDAALVQEMTAVLSALNISAQMGIADGPFAAALAARSATVVAAGTSAAFLSNYPVTALISSGAERLGDPAAHRRANRAGRASAGELVVTDLVDLVSLLQRLGLRTLGSFAAIPAADVLARFGPLGARAHRLASGLDERPLDPTPIPPDLAAQTELDPPVERVDTAAFLAKALAEELHERLLHHGLACLRVRIEARTAGGITLVRLWRHERAGAAGGLTAQGLADRVRWQLDGWLRMMQSPGPGVGPERAGGRGGSAGGDSAGGGSGGAVSGGVDHDLDPGAGEGAALVHLLLAPDEVVPDTGRQLGLWGGASDADLRAARAFSRVQGLIGPDTVRVPVPTGGRGASPIDLIPWGDDTTSGPTTRPTSRPAPRPASRPTSSTTVASTGTRPGSWSGRLPAPLPSIVFDMALPAQVLDTARQSVRISGRGALSAPPAYVTVAMGGAAGAKLEAVTSWAGPWPVEERWWDPATATRRCRLQLVTESHAVYLVAVEAGSWWCEATWT
jgi:protein ImuB